MWYIHSPVDCAVALVMDTIYERSSPEGALLLAVGKLIDSQFRLFSITWAFLGAVLDWELRFKSPSFAEASGVGCNFHG